MKWLVRVEQANGAWAAVRFATDSGKDLAVQIGLKQGAKVSVTDFTLPPVPTPLETEQELWRVAAEREQDNYDDMVAERKLGC